jgi:histone H4
LTAIVKNSAIYCENADRKTITVMDVIYALKKCGRTIYGYGF